MSREVMQKALEALENINNWLPTIGQKGLRDYEAGAITGLREALAQPEEQQSCDKQEPVAWIDDNGNLHRDEPPYSYGPDPRPLYTSPPQRQWVGLTYAEALELIERSEHDEDMDHELVRLVIYKLKEKNT